MIVIFFFAFLLQGMGEEALFRGYLLTTLARRTKIWGAIIISSLIFALFHMGNANFSIIAFINIFLFGIFASVFMLKRGSIWAVSAIHTVWNFAQGNIFGFSVSGNSQMPSVLRSAGENFGWILHGGEFGPEGGLGVTIVLMIAILGALLIPTKKSEYVEPKSDADIESEIA
jgi:membrane protease YdiL (CAAX protease family)